MKNNIQLFNKSLDESLEIIQREDFEDAVSRSLVYALIPLAILITQVLYTAIKFRRSIVTNKLLSDTINKILKTKKNEWTVKVYKDKNPGAFCMIFKDIYVSTGLLKQLSKKEVYAVLLHEAYHVKKIHVIKKIALKYPIFAIAFGITSSVFPFTQFVIIPFILYLIINRSLSIPLDIIIGRKMEINADKNVIKYGYRDELISALNKLEKC